MAWCSCSPSLSTSSGDGDSSSLLCDPEVVANRPEMRQVGLNMMEAANIEVIWFGWSLSAHDLLDVKLFPRLTALQENLPDQPRALNSDLIHEHRQH